MKINKVVLLQAFKTDLKAAETLKRANDEKIEKRRNVYEGNLYGNENKNESQLVVKVAKRQSEWAHASIKDPFVATFDIAKCTPITYEDVEAARQNQFLLNYQFCRQFDRYNFMTKAIKLLDVDGTLVVRAGWDYRDTRVKEEVEVVRQDANGVEYITKEVTENIKVLMNKPTAQVCRMEDIYIDPTCQDDMDNAQFVIYRYESDMSSLKKDGSYKNLDKVQVKDAADDSDYNTQDTTNFEFKDKARKKLVVYEYWGNYDMDGDGMTEPIVCTWIGDTIIKLKSNPYPDKKHPFLLVPFSSVPFQLYGENNIDLIEDNQKVITAITRGMINNMAQSTNGQIGLRSGALSIAEKRKFLEGKNFEFSGSHADIWQGTYNQIPGSAFNMLGQQSNEVESITGVKGFNEGISGGSLGNNATAARGVLSATDVRRADIVRNIAENLIKPLLRKWMAYNSEFLSESEVIRVTNEKFVPIKRDDLEGKIDIDITISTAEANAAKSKELSFMLQTFGDTVPFELKQKILGKIAKLHRMPDLEHDIVTFKAPPNPEQELQVNKLKAEIAKLQAETAEVTNKAKAELGDNTEKMAVARWKNAQADKLVIETQKVKSEKDKLDLDFLKSNDDVAQKNKMEEMVLKYRHELEKEQARHIANMQSLEFQANHNDKNLGVS